jgi:hypothetical protein
MYLGMHVCNCIHRPFLRDRDTADPCFVCEIGRASSSPLTIVPAHGQNSRQDHHGRASSIQCRAGFSPSVADGYTGLYSSSSSTYRTSLRTYRILKRRVDVRTGCITYHMAWCPDRHVPVDVCVGRKRSVGDGIGDDARALSSRRNAGVGAVFRLPRNSTMGRHVTAPWKETDSTRSSHPPPPTTTTCTHAGRFRWAREPHASSGDVLFVLRSRAVRDRLQSTVQYCAPALGQRWIWRWAPCWTAIT